MGRRDVFARSDDDDEDSAGISTALARTLIAWIDSALPGTEWSFTCLIRWSKGKWRVVRVACVAQARTLSTRCVDEVFGSQDISVDADAQRASAICSVGLSTCGGVDQAYRASRIRNMGPDLDAWPKQAVYTDTSMAGRNCWPQVRTGKYCKARAVGGLSLTEILVVIQRVSERSGGAIFGLAL